MRSNFCSRLTVVQYRLLHWLLNSVAALTSICKFSRYMVSRCLSNKYLPIPNRNRICWTPILYKCISKLKASLMTLVISFNNISLWLAKVAAMTLLLVSLIAWCWIWTAGSHSSSRITLGKRIFWYTFLSLVLLKESKHFFVLVHSSHNQFLQLT